MKGELTPVEVGAMPDLVTAARTMAGPLASAAILAEPRARGTLSPWWGAAEPGATYAGLRYGTVGHDD